MSTYLLTWSDWAWVDIDKAVADTAAGVPYKIDWTVFAHKRIHAGDRVFLMRLGAEARKTGSTGIVASGRVAIAPRLLPHRAKPGKSVYKAGIQFDRVLAPENVLAKDELPRVAGKPRSWTPQASGIGIPEDVAAELEKKWGEWVRSLSLTQPLEWIPQELTAIISSYFEMLVAELRGEAYSKARHRRELIPQLQDRSESSIEFKCRNISAVLNEWGFPHIEGYKPASNYQSALADAVDEFVTEHPEWVTRAERALPTAALVAEAHRIEDVEQPPPAAPVKRRRSGVNEQRIKRDYDAVHVANSQMGRAGELFVLGLEKRYLREHGRDDLAERVEHVSETQGDGAGYDIMSFDLAGTARFIEVKTTNLSPSTPFYVSANETNVSRNEAGRYWLYRVYRFSSAPHLFRLHGALEQTCTLEAAVFIGHVGNR